MMREKRTMFPSPYRLPVLMLLLGLACQFGHAQRSGGGFSILSESTGPLVAEGNTSTTGFSQIGASEAIQGTFSTATTGFSGTIGFLASQPLNTLPTDLNFTAPLAFSENQPIGTVVGEFNASDPDANSTLTYHLVSGAGDGNNSLFTLETNGTLKTATIFDYESNASTYAIRVQAKDEFNATVEGNFTVTLTDVYEAPPNTVPTDLNFTAPLTFAENQPIGTVVGEFNATDPDAGATLTYHLVSGAGDGNNTLFTLETNGTLKTATTFDYESNATTYSIRVQAKDEFNATVEGNFTVMLMDDPYDNPLDLTNGLVAWYPFDGNTSDMSGNGNHGTGHQISFSSDINNSSQKALLLSGNGYVNLPNTLFGNRNFTISYYTLVKTDSLPWNIHMSIGATGTEPVFEILYNKSGKALNFNFLSPNNSGSEISLQSSSNSLPLNSWKFITWVMSENHGRTYVDGNKVNEISSIPNDLEYVNSYNNSSITVGAKWEKGVHPSGRAIYYMDGNYDELRIYDRSLPAEEVMLLYNSTKPHPAPSDLNSSSPLIIAENQPIGSVIGEFNATHPDANSTLTYHLFDNNGSTDNSLFTLDSNGTLKSAIEFDYESNSAYTIKVQVRDEHNASMTKSFTVLITDLYEAPELTGTPQSGRWSLKKQWSVAHSYGVFTRIDPVSNKELLYVGNGQGDGTSQVYVYDLDGNLVDSVLGMNYPNDVVLDTNGEMFVAEWALVRAHDENGTLKWRKGRNPTYHETGSGNGHFHNAAGIDVWNGEIFIADQNNHRVQVLDKQGNYLRKFGTQGTTPEKFNDVTDLAFLSDGNLIIADSNYLHYYLKDGTFLKRTNMDGAGTFVSVGPNGEIFSNQRVRDGDGNTLSHIPEINSNARSAFTSQGDIVTSYNGIIKLWSTRNYPPTDLNSTAPLTFAENQPIGTVVGEFNATDPDANSTLTYHLVSGAGDGNNTLFTLETNGTLKTATTFDYETNASTYSIRVQAKDEFNASVENNFTVTLTDVYEPSQPNHFVDLNSTVNLEMIWVEPGTFTMGSPTTEAGRRTDETEHNVTLTKGFYLGKYEVTQAQYEAVMTGNANSLNPAPSNWPNNPNRPVEKVSWDDAQIFLTRLNAAEQAAGRLPAGWSYVLPAEAEWEYASRAGTTSSYSWGNTITSANANFNQSGISQTRDVGQYSANPWGFFDMHGNVWEWTTDRYGGYPVGPVTDPTGAASGSNRSVRGGSWAHGVRSARRHDEPPSRRGTSLGFRVAYRQIFTAVLEPVSIGIQDGLLLRYSFEETNGSSVQDSSGNNRNGSLVNITGPDLYVSGKFNSGIKLGSGATSYIDMGANQLPMPNDWTISTWFEAPLVDTGVDYFRTLVSGGNARHVVFMKGGINELGIYVSGVTGFRGAGYGGISLGAGWHHLVALGMGSETIFYVDGVEVGRSDHKVTSAIDTIGNISAAWERFADKIDEFRVYDRSLSASEIAILYGGGSGDFFTYDLFLSNATVLENAALLTPIGNVSADNQAHSPYEFSLISGKGDDHNAFFQLDVNGSLKTNGLIDYESNSSLSLRVRVKDKDDRKLEKSFSIQVIDVLENTSPTNLNSTAPLTFAENQPIGTVVGDFNATDPDAGATLTYHLVSGAGDGNNSLFTLETNGTLKTATTFDYETNASTYAIRIQAKDEHNATVEGNFTVTLTDVYEAPPGQSNNDGNSSSDGNTTTDPTNPVVDGNSSNEGNATIPSPVPEYFRPIVDTLPAGEVNGTTAKLHGSVMDTGGWAPTEFGFLLSSRPNPKENSSGVIRLAAESNASSFSADASALQAGKKYYFRAYARNRQGTGFGLEETFVTTSEPPSPSWIEARFGTAAGWWTSPWLGNFFLAENGWVRHQNLGWVFPMQSPTAGLWLWKEGFGWLWTDESIYPFLYRNVNGGWLYFYGRREETLLFYDYSTKGWITRKAG
jgi:formylglycine-generating enzyme